MVKAEIIERQRAISKTPMLERIASIRDSLVAAGDEAQQLRHLPGWASKEMAEIGLYRYALPAELGGENLRARQQIEIVEAAAAIDGSVGWCVQISSEINALVIRQMGPALATEIFDDWYALVCSGHGPANGPNPGRKARRDGDGWRLNYQGSFASGCQNATWNYLMGPMCVDEATGETAQASFMIPKGEFEIVDTWNTSGMRGSGSHDVRMVDCYVPPHHLLPGRSLAPSELWDNPTYRNPTHAIYNKAAVALGVCRGAIDNFIGLAMGKVPWGLSTSLKDQSVVQYRVGEAQAKLMAVRSFVMETQDRLEDHLGPLPAKGGRLMPEWEYFWPALLACAHAAQTCREVVSMINNTAATTGCRMDSPLERQLRDAQQAANHALISYRHYEQLGATFLGHPPASSYLALCEPV
ncbi:acyl-CoA dehydrogenase family protein [Emcibacter sp. SYSU 3D8]|uniref:acyl-CoA dehydrogenase family protein n=1 Tax=Emcibacter sp. SYSU 3D8 TaxID=3133969 RepID=UPI0031FF428A